MNEVLAQTMSTERVGYRSFYENLEHRMSFEEVASLKVLGTPMFELVDVMVTELLGERVASDHAFTSFPLEQFLWELQVFCYRYIRAQCPNVFRIKNHCQTMLRALDEAFVRSAVVSQLTEAYEEFFFGQDTQSPYLV